MLNKSLDVRWDSIYAMHACIYGRAYGRRGHSRFKDFILLPSGAKMQEDVDLIMCVCVLVDLSRCVQRSPHCIWCAKKKTDASMHSAGELVAR